MKKFLSKLSSIVRSTYDYSLLKWLLVSLAVAFGEEFFLEILGRRSFIAAVSFVFHTPYIFLYNILILYFTFSICLLFRRRGFIFGLIAGLWLIVGFTNFAVLGYRITPFSAIDFLMITDMLSMINIYFSLLQRILLFAGIIIFILVVAIAFLKTPKIKGKIQYIPNIIVCLVLFVLVAITTFFNLNMSIISDKFSNLGTAYKDYGFAYCFANSVVDVGVSKPDDYSQESVEEIVAKTENLDDDLDIVQNTEDMPDIVIVQLESFIDANRISGLHTDIDPIANFRFFEEHYPSGYLTVPAIGAGTANTEFEILTGMKSKLFGSGEYPYKTVLTDTPCESMPQLLLQQGYGTHAIHNNKAKFYSRDESYASLGFQSFTSLEYMTNYNVTNTGWAKDDCLPEQIEKALDVDQGGPSFVLTISVQGHGKYPKDKLNCTEHVKVTLDSGDPELINSFGYYVNQTYEMDQMIMDLKKRLDARGKKYMLLLYGDHIPNIDFTNNPLNRGADNQTEYVLVSNFNMNLKDQDLNAYELSDYMMKACHLKRGIMQKAHEAYFDADNEEVFNEVAHTLQYDMLYGNRYVYQSMPAYTIADMSMGVEPITVDAMTFQRQTKYLLVTGHNFTPFSRVIINDDRYDTVFVSNEELIVTKDALGDVLKNASDEDVEISIAQIDEDKHELTRTEPQRYLPPED